MAPPPGPLDRFLDLLRQALADGALVKLTLGRPAAKDSAVLTLFARPVQLKTGPHLSLVLREARRDTTQNLPLGDAFERLSQAVREEFLDAHLFTVDSHVELRRFPGRRDRLTVRKAESTAPTGSAAHDRSKAYPIPLDRPWLRALGVTNERGQPRAEMSAKLRQIESYADLLRPLLAEASLDTPEARAGRPLRVVDMGCGKGYLTFAVADLVGPGAEVLGIELRADLVEHCNAVARDSHMTGLRFQAGTIADAPLAEPDVVIALHACDTATDDALARGIEAQARILVVAPCCQKELRPQLQAPAVLAGALRHGIFAERQAEFVTDALRTMLLEWAGYRARAFEFVSTEHTAKNLMIAAVRTTAAVDTGRSDQIRDFARFYGIRRHHLATRLGFAFTTDVD
ncbi:hypothetical protein GALL_317680 [mine drainage metagenome]|uniref:Methyltransferase domain-containing protein n=1 Tax=mine drainage metagenome TaxID=410659 RepID=A0A1J5QRY5_9ZZZZ